ncbi:tyrosine-type recombinase/integrase [Bradyrhizobium sp. 6(2017)]|uniref:tyrosine-type recombinase/integrase n=1 Tax=Bradyrhizobium sp. 6(2017) TaxID=1197460 RepID=UPI0013E19D2F|nr:site-specific integrase [Bradyrhizobium sp. 6(2017)]QIG92437.1 site-specific integrase [Bradyrhizobium sp. 6(2017)]
MAGLKIATDSVAALMKSAVPNKTTYYFDSELAGFGLYRTTTGTATFFAEFRPVAGGSKKRLKLGRVGTLKANDAREAARKAIANAALGKDLAKDRSDERASLTVEELVTLYIEEFVDRHRKTSSAGLYRMLLKKHVKPRLGSTKAVVLTRVDVQRAHAVMTREARVSANRAIKLVSAAYGWGARHGHVPEGVNPASGAKLNEEKGRERFLTTDELLSIGNAMIEAETVGLPVDAGKAKHAPIGQMVVMSPYATAAIRLLMLTGARLREILNLRWSEVDLVRGVLRLPDSKTGKKTIYLPTAAVEILKGLRKWGAFVIAGESAGTKDEKPRHDLKRPWAAICKRARVSGVRIHDLRHTFASTGVGDQMGLPVIGTLLGHADPSTTQRYAHLADEAARRAVEAIGTKIAKAMGEQPK